MKGVHSDNLRWLDGLGYFPTKPPEYGIEPDFEVLRRICRKVRNTDHLKLLYYEYDPGLPWAEVQENKWRMVVSNAQPTTLTIRVMPRGGDHEQPLRFAQRVLNAAALAYDVGCAHGLPQWYEIGNEPNLIGEGFGGDAMTFNRWFISVVEYLRARGFVHGLFYPGLSPISGYLSWYNEPTTRQALSMANGIALHAYNDIVLEVNKARSFLQSSGLGHYPLMLSEAGSLLGARLEEFAKLSALPLVAFHVFIIEGKSNGAWDDKYILTEAECRALA